MFTSKVLHFIKALWSKEQSHATPSPRPGFDRKTDFEIIRENEEWLRQQPRSSFEIATHLFCHGATSVKHLYQAMHEMIPALCEAGYEAREDAESDLCNCVWVKI